MSRVERRAFGAGIPRLVDAPMSPATIVDFYAAIADAIANNEPRFRVTKLSIADATSAGALSLLAAGIYYPRGHLGDFSVSVPQTATVTL
jgi:phage baseplate assembly protein W